MERIKKLLDATADVFDLIRKTHLIGKSEKWLKNLIIEKYNESVKGFFFNADVISGERSSFGEGDATEKIIEKGDAIILDLFPKYKGLHSDISRTFFAGEPSAKQREVYEIVKKAQQNTAKTLRSGIKAKEIYDIERSNLIPYEATFFHHAGHLFGVENVKQSQFLPDREERIKTGDLVALEPAIYIKGEFGIRLENDYLITDSGSELLFDYSLDIENFITK